MEVIIVCFVSSSRATAGDSLLAKGIQCSNCVFTQEAEGWSLKKKINNLLFVIFINIGRDGSEREQEREFNCYTTLKGN